MKRFQLIGAALVAVFALGALTAASASATFLLAEWLLNGVAITSENLVEVEGELLLEDSKNVPVIGKSMVLCSAILVGAVQPNSLGIISEVLSLEHTAPPILCPVQEGCEASTSTADMSPVGLPWENEAELFEQTGVTAFAYLTIKRGGGTFGWRVENCLVLGLPQKDECTISELVTELSLEGTTLLANISLAFELLVGVPFAFCTASNGENGVDEGSGTFVVSGGGELTASSETAVS